MNGDVVPAVVNLLTMVFPVVGTNPETREAVRPLVYGTAFCVGPGVFLTAAHVIANIEADRGRVTLLDLAGRGGALPYFAERCETLPHDIGVIACRMNALALLNWEDAALPLLTDVSAIGYPYAVTRQDEPPAWNVALRGFKGSVITRTKLWGVQGAPIGYEILCPFPKGLSGAPLMRADAPVPEMKVSGIVVGMGLVDVEGQITEFGQAVDILVVREMRSEILGGTLREIRDRLLADHNRRQNQA